MPQPALAPPFHRRPPCRPCSGSSPLSMWQLPSKEEARLRVVQAEQDKIRLLLDTLKPLARAEAAKGRPATLGSRQAQRSAAVQHFRRLVDESVAIRDRRSECRMRS